MQYDTDLSKLPLISIIVPVYKAERYLSACIRSILKQTYRNYELILIDDGSPDDCGTICDDFASRDSRIRVIHQANAGVSSARNAGIAVAKGEWVVFIDADDLITPGYLTVFIQEVLRKPSIDMVVQGAIGFHGDRIQNRIRNKFIFRNFSGKINHCLSDDTIGKGLLDMKTPWGKLFRLSKIRENKLRFSDGLPYGEDTIFYYQYLSLIDEITLCRETKYLNRVDNPNSATKKRYPPIVYWTVYEEKSIILINLYNKHNIHCPYPNEEDISWMTSLFKMASECCDSYSYHDLVKIVIHSPIFSS